MLLSEILMLFVSGLLFVRSLLFWKRSIQPKTMICEAILASLAMLAIATGRWTIGVALTLATALLEGVMLFALLKWQRNRDNK